MGDEAAGGTTITFPSEMKITKSYEDKLLDVASRIYANMTFDPQTGKKEKPEVLAKKAVNYAKALLKELGI